MKILITIKNNSTSVKTSIKKGNSIIPFHKTVTQTPILEESTQMEFIKDCLSQIKNLNQ